MERARKQVPMSALGQERTSSGQVPMFASPQKRTLSLASSLASPFAIDGQTILALTAPAQYSVFPRIFRKKATRRSHTLSGRGQDYQPGLRFLFFSERVVNSDKSLGCGSSL